MDVGKRGTRVSFVHFLKFVMNFFESICLNMSQLSKYADQPVDQLRHFWTSEQELRFRGHLFKHNLFGVF